MYKIQTPRTRHRSLKPVHYTLRSESKHAFSHTARRIGVVGRDWRKTHKSRPKSFFDRVLKRETNDVYLAATRFQPVLVTACPVPDSVIVYRCIIIIIVMLLLLFVFRLVHCGVSTFSSWPGAESARAARYRPCTYNFHHKSSTAGLYNAP